MQFFIKYAVKLFFTTKIDFEVNLECLSWDTIINKRLWIFMILQPKQIFKI